MKVFLVTLTLLLGCSANVACSQDIDHDAEHYWGYRSDKPIVDAVAEFNRERKDLIESHGMTPLSTDEVINALALGQVILGQRDMDLADTFPDYMLKKILPKGSRLHITSSATIGPSGKELKRKFFYIYLVFNAIAPNGHWDEILKPQPSPEHPDRVRTIPVRLVPR